MKNPLSSFKHWLRGWRFAVLLTVLVLLVAAAVYGSHSSIGSQSAGRWAAARVDSYSQPIMLDGQLEPATAINITAPFDGRVIKMPVRTGDRVAVGALLLQIVSNDLMAELRDAEAALIRAQLALDQVLHWNDSAEMLAAQRQLSASQTAKNNSQRTFLEMQTLYDKGIVSRIEFDSAQNEANSAQGQVSAAADNLAAVREKGSALQRKLLQLDRDSRRTKLGDTQDKLARSNITAPIAGVVLYPVLPVSAVGIPAKEIEVGSFVTSKDTLMTIGDTTNLAVRASLDEFDILRVKPGLPVEVTVNANSDIKLKGQVARVSSQARKGVDGPGRGPTYELEVLIRDIAPEVRASLRIGMSVRMQIQPETGQATLLVPLAAIVMAADGSTQVLRRARGARQGVLVKVKLGKTLLDQVEVVAGVAAPDEVWVAEGIEVNDNIEREAAKPGLPGLKITDE